ncbi:hypothetical protein JTE90_006958, partial [Oedothorax gibbosus]
MNHLLLKEWALRAPTAALLPPPFGEGTITMRRPIAMKKDGIQTRNRKIASRGKRRKSHKQIEDMSNSPEYTSYNTIPQYARPPYLESENMSSLFVNDYNPPSNSGFNSLANLQHSGYAFHPYSQTVVGA